MTPNGMSDSTNTLAGEGGVYLSKIAMYDPLGYAVTTPSNMPGDMALECRQQQRPALSMSLIPLVPSQHRCE